MARKKLTTKPKTARAVHANRGIEAWYREKLEAMIDAMHASVIYWLKAEYRKKPPHLAQDASPVDMVKRVMGDLSDRWTKHFDLSADDIAEAYLKKLFGASEASFKRALRDAGWTVQLKMTPAMRDAFRASLAENVGLIKSIPAEYLQQVEGIVMRSYSAGRDLGTMVEELQKLYPKARNRAVLISRDQSNKANAVVNRTRQMELGITEAIWLHSHAGKNPRPDHVAANGKKYKIEKGCLISGEFIQPGEQINCRCTSRPVLPI